MAAWKTDYDCSKYKHLNNKKNWEIPNIWGEFTFTWTAEVAGWGKFVKFQKFDSMIDFTRGISTNL